MCHYLHGALTCELDRFDLALQLAFATIPDTDENKQLPIWRSWQIAGRPKSLGGNRELVVEFMRGRYEQEPTLGEMFGTRRDYDVAFGSYSLLLLLLEMADCDAREK